MGAEFKPWTAEEIAAWEAACKAGTLMRGDPEFAPKRAAKVQQKQSRMDATVDALMNVKVGS